MSQLPNKTPQQQLVPMSCDEKNFIEQCKTLGLSSEQVFELLKLKLKLEQEKIKARQEELKLEQEKLKLEIELFKLKAGIDDHEIKKRKFEEINNHDNEQTVKKENIRKYSVMMSYSKFLNI